MPTVVVAGADRLVADRLGTAGFEVRAVIDGLAALDEVTADPPAAMVLDADLPGTLSSADVTRWVRAQGRTLPICLIGSDPLALAAGADDHMPKPFALHDLASRLRALTRPPVADPSAPVFVGDLRLDVAGKTAARRGRDLGLTGREFDLLRVLARHSGRVLDRARVIEQVWGYGWEPNGDNVVDAFAGSLRAKLEAAGEPRILTTVPNAGFVLNP